MTKVLTQEDIAEIIENSMYDTMDLDVTYEDLAKAAAKAIFEELAKGKWYATVYRKGFDDGCSHMKEDSEAGKVLENNND